MGRKGYDVAVIGAGPAGVAAAVTAAGLGASVLLLEEWNRLGGTVTAGMHRALCGLYAHEPRSPLDTLNDGVQRAVVERMLSKDDQTIRVRQLGRTWVLEFPIAVWESALADMCHDAAIELRLKTRVTAVYRSGSHISAVELNRSSANLAEVGAIVDCTGAGRVLQMAGEDTFFPAEETERHSLQGFSVRLGGLSGDLEMLRLQIPYILTRAAIDGSLPPAARFTMFHPGPGDGEGVCKLALSPEQWTGERLTDYTHRVIQHLSREAPGFADARITESSPHALPRIGHRLRGRHLVTEDDIVQARQHGPMAIHAWWPIERWDMPQGPTYVYPPADRHYDIPADALASAAIDNLFAAGACLSATPAAIASIRAAGICLATGSAAGRLAALPAR